MGANPPSDIAWQDYRGAVLKYAGNVRRAQFAKWRMLEHSERNNLHESRKCKNTFISVIDFKVCFIIIVSSVQGTLSNLFKSIYY